MYSFSSAWYSHISHEQFKFLVNYPILFNKVCSWGNFVWSFNNNTHWILTILPAKHRKQKIWMYLGLLGCFHELIIWAAVRTVYQKTCKREKLYLVNFSCIKYLNSQICLIAFLGYMILNVLLLHTYIIDEKSFIFLHILVKTNFWNLCILFRYIEIKLYVFTKSFIWCPSWLLNNLISYFVLNEVY